MKTSFLPLVVVSLGLLVGGCGKADKPAGPAASSGNGLPAGEFPPARQTSFAEVTGQLDPGGNVYGYMATDQWLAGLATNVANVRELVLGLPDVSTKDRENITRVFDSLNDLVVETGLEDLTGVGLSGVQIGPDLFRTKAIFHHQRGQGEGLLWNVMGKQAHDLAGLDLLPATTAVAAFGDVDVKAVWEAIADGVKKSEVPELVDGLKQWEAEFEKGTKLAWSDVLGSLGGEAGLVFTLDQANMIDLPFLEGMQLPEPGFLLAVKVKNDLLYDRISSELKKNSMVQLTDEKGLKMCAMPIPLPLPVQLEITVARSGDYLFFATATKHVRNAIAVRDGKQPGMRKSPEFPELRKHLPAQGNHFLYVDQRFSGTLITLQQQLLESGLMPPKQADLLRSLWNKQKPTYGLAIASRTPTGWQIVSVGNQDSSKAVVVAAAAFPAGLVAAIAVPNFVKARGTAQHNACINNLRVIDNAKQQWALENNKPDNATPLNRDLTAYFSSNQMPTCPQGGRYTVGKLSVPPKCSQTGHELLQ
jgi:hypothetical protein